MRVLHIKNNFNYYLLVCLDTKQEQIREFALHNTLIIYAKAVYYAYTYKNDVLIAIDKFKVV